VAGSYEDLHQQVICALHEAVNLERDAGPAKLKKRLDLLRQGAEPVFVVLAAEGLSADWLKRLRATELFAWVNFLILSGEAGVMPSLMPEEAWLTPLLPSGFEREVWDDYENARQILRLA
jgi:hypothetical protein